MRFVPVKSKERQAACMLMTVRERLVTQGSFNWAAGKGWAASQRPEILYCDQR
jgi:transposase